MASYQYVDKTGQMKTVEANDPTSAISSAVDRDPTSGVIVNQATPTVAPTTTEPTVAEMFKTYNQTSSDITPTLSQSDFTSQYDLTGREEKDIRSKVMNQYQGEINAAKSAYATLLQDTQKMGLGRLGETTAQQARRGLIGSDFGTGLTEGVRDYNAGQERKVLESQATAIANIMAQANSAARDEIAAKRAAKTGGYTAYQDYLSKAQERKDAGVKKLASSFILQNLNPNEIDPAELTSLAKTYGVTTQDIINSYLTEKKAEDEKAQELYAKLPAGRVGTSAGVQTGGLSDLAKAVQDGSVSLKDLTPTQRGQVAAELSRSGSKPKQQQAVDKATDIINAIDSLETVGYSGAVGPVSSRLPTVRGATADAEAYFQNLKSLLTLDNLTLLQGTGPLSDSDLKVLAGAATPLELNMSEEGFAKELARIRAAAQKIVNNQQNTQTIDVVQNEDDALLGAYGL